MMPLWVWIIVTVFGILFGLKLLYVASIGGLLPVTRGALEPASGNYACCGISPSLQPATGNG